MEAPRYIISRNKIILVNSIYIQPPKPTFLVARKNICCFQSNTFFQQGIWLWEITGKVQEIMGKLRVEIWKYLENQVFLKIFFLKSWEKRKVVRFQPKKKWVKGAIGIIM